MRPPLRAALRARSPLCNSSDGPVELCAAKGKASVSQGKAVDQDYDWGGGGGGTRYDDGEKGDAERSPTAPLR